MVEGEGDAALARVGAVEHGTPLPPLLGAGSRRGVAHSVGTLDRLDLDHVGAERGEHVGRGRARPEGGEVEDPEPVEGEAVAGARGRRRRARLPSHAARMLTESRRRGERAAAATVDRVRHPRLHEPTARMLDEGAPGPEVVEGGEGRAVADRRHRDAQQRGELDDLVAGALRRPVVDDCEDLVHALRTPDGARQVAVVDEVGSLDQDEDGVNRRRGEIDAIEESKREQRAERRGEHVVMKERIRHGPPVREQL